MIHCEFISDLLKITLNCSCVLLLSHILPVLYLSRFLKPREDLTFYYSQTMFSVCQSFIFKNSHLLSNLALCNLDFPLYFNESLWLKKKGGID